MIDNNVNFFGVVEEVETDPNKLGRVKVRVINHHEELDTDDLPWMTVGVPALSSSQNGIGISPVGLKRGSLVYGMFFDGEARQVGIVMGTIATIPGMDDEKHGVNKRARGQVVARKTNGPNIDGAPTYPNNQVIETTSGHVIEIDDTPSAERVVVYHKSGSHVAILANGDVVINSVNDTYHLSSGNANTVVKQTSSTHAKAIKIVSDGKIDITANDQCNITSSGKIVLTASAVSIQ